MIIAAIIVMYIVFGLIVGKLVHNDILTEYYEKSLRRVRHAQREDLDYIQSAEERALSIAKDEMQDEGVNVLIVGACAWFWPLAVVGFILSTVVRTLYQIMTGLTFLKSKPEREVNAILAEQERKSVLDQKENDLELERKRLRVLAETLGMSTVGLED